MSDPEPRIVLGTSGFSFKDWVGPFYPAGTPANEFLVYYAQHFRAVEVNSTYYRIPHPRVMDHLVRKTPEEFRFVVKLHRSMTHEGSHEPAVYDEFLKVLEPLKLAGKYDGVLAQFPGSFRRTDDNRRHLLELRRRLAGEPMFAEFRHDSWLTPALEPSLRREHIGFCVVDEPRLPHLVPPVLMRTSEDAYVRFHGRNADQWWGGGPLRYDYDYKEAELREWVGRIAELAAQARRTYLFFNNCHAGQAARNAKLMQQMLRQEGLPV